MGAIYSFLKSRYGDNIPPLQREKDMDAIAASFCTLSPLVMDKLPKEAGYFASQYPEWEPSKVYKAGDLVQYQGMAVQIRQDVTAQAHQPPFSAGMTAIYIPYLVADENGIKPFAYGCAANTGELFYAQDGAVYQYIGVDNPSCIYPPSKELPALWQRQSQTNVGGI